MGFSRVRTCEVFHAVVSPVRTYVTTTRTYVCISAAGADEARYVRRRLHAHVCYTEKAPQVGGVRDRAIRDSCRRSHAQIKLLNSWRSHAQIKLLNSWDQ